jgi:hypothetical protein
MYVILARDGRSAVAFRRGPRNNMLLVRWDLKKDTFEEGQWVRHKVYHRRCDLSPDGEHLIYFAANFVKPLYSWSAVSRPPHFSALTLWPKIDAWGGGGLFSDADTIELNHLPHDFVHDVERPPPRKLTLRPLGEASGRGEDDPIESLRMIRDGWQLEIAGQPHFDFGMKSKQFYRLDPASVMVRQNPRYRSISLRRIFTGGGVQQGKHYVEHFLLSDEAGNRLRLFEMLDWADWDKNGDLLVADDGKIWRLDANLIKSASPDDPYAECKLLADFSDRTFQPRIAPDWAKDWKRRRVATN